MLGTTPEPSGRAAIACNCQAISLVLFILILREGLSLNLGLVSWLDWLADKLPKHPHLSPQAQPCYFLFFLCAGDQNTGPQSYAIY